MEPRAGAPEALSPTTADGVTRVRLAAVSMVLTALAFIQAPGLLTADTKFDLVLDPERFLSRAVHLWDGSSAFGQLQNQAYGYLWPMGPFFWVGEVLGAPGWVVQRSWLALVLVVAFLGAASLARVLGVRSDLACILGGVAYALSPRMLTTLGPISVEAWPSALAPWVLLPLVIGSVRGSPRSAAARSALAVAMIGGVNAAATFAVLPLAAWWLLTRTSGPRRRALMTWWPLCTVAACLWWLGPLFLLGSYSPPFLDFIEAAANTTFPTTLFDSLRGTSNWVPYVDTSSLAGNDLLRQRTLILESAVLMVFGVAGVLSRHHPHRVFLGGGVLLGLLLVTAGHVGSVAGWAAPTAQDLLDGTLAPLRNVHKFDPVLRLPMVLGLALFVDATVEKARARRDSPDRSGSRLSALLLVSTAVFAVVGAAIPALAGRVPPAGATTGVPDYWHHAARWLQQNADGTTLLVPGSPFAEYVWGDPRDEPFQSLARSPWAVRNAVPLTPAGNIRMLDAVESRLAQGKGSAGLVRFLERAGVSHLVVRNDLRRSADVPDPVLVHQALAQSPGIERIASFGPRIGGEAHLEDEDGRRLLINSGWQDEYPAVEVFEVDGTATGGALAVTAQDPPVVVGGPEDLLSLADLGVLGSEPTRLAVHADQEVPPGGPVVLTDGLRVNERNFGRVHDGSSQTLTDEDPPRLGKPTRDYLLDPSSRWSTTATHAGGRVSASSSLSDANAVPTVEPGHMPFAAADGDPGTAWVANVRIGATAWWRLDVDQPIPVDGVSVTAGEDDEVVRVTSEHAVSEPLRIAAGVTRTVPIVDQSTAWVRVDDASGRPGHALSLAEVEVPGAVVSRSLRLPEVPEAWGAPEVVVLRAVDDARTGCAEIDAAVRCVADQDVAGEEPAGFSRLVRLPAARDYAASLRVRARPGDALLTELLRDQPLGVSASTTGTPDPRGSALAAIDGDRGSTWTAALSDLRPQLRLSWLRPRPLSGLRVVVAPDAAARAPDTLTLTWPGGTRDVDLDSRGRVTFPPVVTDQLTLSVREAEPVTSLDFESRSQAVPVGISELKLRGVPYEPVVLPTASVARPCGSGPRVLVDGVPLLTTVAASPAAIYAGRSVAAVFCGSGQVSLAAAETEVEVLASPAFVPEALVLTSGVTQRSEVVPAPASAGEGSTATYRPRGEGVLALAANTNPGWSATRGGRDLEPVILDGWRQGWTLEGAGEVRTEFVPEAPYRASLVVGAGVVLLLLWWCRPARRRPRPEDAPALRDARLPDLAALVLGVVVGGLLAGWPGAGVGLGALVAARIASARVPQLDLLVVAAPLVAAAGLYVLRPWGADEGWAGSTAWPHYCVLAACTLWLGWSGPDPAPGGRLFKRTAGRSTSR